MPMPRPRVLFLAEAATLAHVARATVLASSLDPARYEVRVATAGDFRPVVEAASLPVVDLYSIGTRAYLAAVAAGDPVYPLQVLRRYVDDDLRVMGDFAPDLVVGDFRLSLAVSARLARTPYVSISNAYWSPYASTRYEVPVHAATRALGVGVADAAFQVFGPLIMAHHCLPMHRLRRQHGMPSLGFDLRRVFTEADLTLFCDVPQMAPTAPPPGQAQRYRYIGPVVWSPAVEWPAELAPRNAREPLVYVSLGSSGDASALDLVVNAVIAGGYRAAVVSPSDRWSTHDGAAVVCRPSLPGDRLAAQASAVVCNGGSPGTHQALLHGTPVLGIPSNLDQLLNMQCVKRTGAGLSVRADQLSASVVRSALQTLVNDPAVGARARSAQQQLTSLDAGKEFVQAVEALLSHRKR